MAVKLRSPRAFAAHLVQFVALALALLALFLGAGVLGYHSIAHLGWIDALLNAAMILTGMGPVDPMPDDAAKLFASAYALIGGAVYPALAALVLYPIVHRMMALLHLQSLSAPDPTDDP